MRRPRAGFASLPPGGPGQPSVPTKRDCPSVGWTWRGRRRAKACRIGGPAGPRRRPEVTAPGTEIAAWRAERRPRSRKGTRLDGRLVRRLARHTLAFGGARKRDDGVPGAEKNTGAGACPRLFDNCIEILADGARSRCGWISLSRCGQLTLLRQFIDLYHSCFRAPVQLALVI